MRYRNRSPAMLQRRAARVLIATLAMLAMPGAVGMAQARSQAGPDLGAARCDSILRAPTMDSVLVDVGMLVRPWDAEERLPATYRAMIVDGIWQSLVLPRPLVLETYAAGAWTDLLRELASVPPDDSALLHDDASARWAFPVVRGTYRVHLDPDGHLRAPRVLGGARNAAFDDAVLAALDSVDALHLLSAVPESAGIDRRGMDLRIEIAPHKLAAAHDAGAPAADTLDGMQTIMRLRLPRYRVLGRWAYPGAGSPTLAPPVGMQITRKGASVVTEFVLQPDGRADPGSIQVLRSTPAGLETTMEDWLGKAVFVPTKLAPGCIVRSLIEYTFSFKLSPE